MNDLEKAKKLLTDKGYTLVLCKGETVYTSNDRGVSPMLKLIEDGTDLKGFSAADRVIGRAAAMLFVLAGIKELHTQVISRPAAELLKYHGITFSYDEITEMIINRSGDGGCPMELAVLDITDPKEGHKAIITRLSQLRKEK